MATTTKSESVRYVWNAKTVTTTIGSGSPIVDTFSSAVDSTVTGQVTRWNSPPDWKERIKNCRSATSRLEGTKVSATVNDTGKAVRYDRVTSGSLAGQVRKSVLQGSVGLFDTYGAMPSENTALLDATILAARTRFAKRLLAEQQKIQSLVAVGEIGQTVRMIRNLAGVLHHGLFDYLAALKKRRKKAGRGGSPSARRKKTREIIANTWLECTFGWQPLINDIDGLAHGLAEANVNATKQFQTVQVAERRQAATQTVTSVQNCLMGGWVRFQTVELGQATWDASVRFKGAVNLQPEGTNALTNQLGLRLRDIVPSLWELIPYSFAVDYFSNVGDIIALNSIRRSDVRWIELGWACDSARTHQLKDVLCPANAGVVYLSHSFSPPGKATLSRKTIHREEYTGTLVPRLQFEIPGIKQALNLGALVVASRRTSKELSAY